MARKRKNIQLANVKTNVKAPKLSPTIVKKHVARTRQDIQSWNRGLQLTNLEDNPKWHAIQQLFNEIKLDALVTSQYNNRQLKGLAQHIILKKPNGDIDTDQTAFINNANFVNDINRHILDSKYYGYSLIEFAINENDQLGVELIPRTNIDPTNGVIYPDYTEDKKIFYRDTAEYGTWLLEFGEKNDYGLFNAAVPHVLFKRFAQSCYSEYCEIAGIPPRVMKTNTQDPSAVARAEQMMTDMGSASWFIIDESEVFEWANANNGTGEVYISLINLCNNELSLLFTGAVIGQDTKNGSRSKDESGQDMLQTLVDSDLGLLEREWNTKVIPALVKLGFLKGELTYAYDKAEDLQELWKMTSEALPYYEMKTEWMKEKFGLEIEGKRAQPMMNNLNLGADFFA
ncbi:MAG: phage portal protein family protein [Gelidibacter sp.]